MFKAAEINLEAFNEPLSSEAAYWIGFLRADGCISEYAKRPDKIYWFLIVGLKREDHLHLRKLRKFWGSPGNVWFQLRENNYGTSDSCRIKLNVSCLRDTFTKYGLVPRKTKIDEGICSPLDMSPDFWRGVIDGDGSVGFGKNGDRHFPALSVSGVPNLVEQASKFFSSITSKPHLVRNRSNSFSVINVTWSDAKSIVDYIYYENCIALDRKVESAKEILKWKIKTER